MVLIKELQSLGLDVRLYSQGGDEIELKENIDDGIDFNLEREDDKEKLHAIDEELAAEFIQSAEGELDDEACDEDDLSDEEEMYDDLTEDDLLDEELFDNDLAEDNIDNDEDNI